MRATARARGAGPRLAYDPSTPYDPSSHDCPRIRPRPVHDPEAPVLVPTVAATAPGAVADVTRTAELPKIEGPEPADTDADDTGAVVARHGAVMAAGSVVSRVTGFLRVAAIGAAIGAVAVADDYNLANTLPGMVYELLLGGVLASVVVPLLVRARTKDVDRGEAYTQRLLSLAAIFLAAATVVAVACAPIFTALLTSDSTAPADRRLITVLAYLLLPMIFGYGMAALFAAVLNTRGHFAAPMWTPILNNLVVITMAGVFILLTGATQLRAESLTAAQIAVLGLGTTLGIVVQATALVARAATRRFPVEVAVGLPRASPTRTGPRQFVDARLRPGEPDRPRGDPEDREARR